MSGDVDMQNCQFKPYSRVLNCSKVVREVYIHGKTNFLLHGQTTCECENSMHGDVVKL